MTDSPDRVVHHVTGPTGAFTEAFDEHTVDLLVRLDLIECVRTGHHLEISVPGTDEWVPTGPTVKFYEPKERP